MKVLNEVVGGHREEVVFRFVSHQTDEDFLHDQGMSLGQNSEMIELLNSCGMSDSLEGLVEAPFRPKRHLYARKYPMSRFSDGSFPVGYFSLEAETAEAEVRYWFCKRFAGKPSEHRTAWYSRFTCDFRGHAKDLRPLQTMWPDLMHRDDYTFCNRLGAEAATEGLDGLLVPSVRRSSGTNVPVFARRALSNAREHSLVEVRCHVSHGSDQD